jgi:ABC-2 type transport system permease protein
MNILKREMRAGRKAFLFWMIGMFLLCYVGIIKYESYTTSGSMMELLNSFPRVVLAVMGVVGVNIGTLSGYTALMFYYVLICAVIYAVHLGSAAVTRESVDKTYEFVFTKPCSRARILGLKLTAAYIYLTLFCIFNGAFALLAVGSMNTTENVAGITWFCVLTSFLVGALFVALSAFFASMAKKPEKGALYGNLAFLYAFILGVGYNMLENPGVLKLISPFSYFSPADQVAQKLDVTLTIVTLALTCAFLFGSFARFKRKDLA